MNGGQNEAHRGADPEFAVKLDMTARLLHKSVDHAETKAGSGHLALGREEGLEGAALHLVGHSQACVDDRDDDMVARTNIGGLGGIGGVDT